MHPRDRRLPLSPRRTHLDRAGLAGNGVDVRVSGPRCRSSPLLREATAAPARIVRDDAGDRTRVSEKTRARHREHKIAKAASRLDRPSSSMSAPSAQHPRTHTPTTACSRARDDRARRRTGRAAPRRSAAGVRHGARHREDARVPRRARRAGRPLGRGRRRPRRPSTAHPARSPLPGSQGHAQALAGPWQGCGMVASRETDTPLVAPSQPVRAVDRR